MEIGKDTISFSIGVYTTRIRVAVTYVLKEDICNLLTYINGSVALERDIDTLI